MLDADSYKLLWQKMIDLFSSHHWWRKEIVTLAVGVVWSIAFSIVRSFKGEKKIQSEKYIEKDDTQLIHEDPSSGKWWSE